MKREEINIRDPFVMKSRGKYYLYGTRSATTWGPADGFDCYESVDLADWEGPFEIYHRPDGSPFDCCYWAPECYEYEGRYYLITTLGSGKEKKAVYALVSDSPKGPFAMHSRGSLTPEGWKCIDGTLFFAPEGSVWLVFSHTFEDVPAGDMCAVELNRELTAASGNPVLLFHASDAGWNMAIPFAKEEFGLDGDVYFSDGPFVQPLSDGSLCMLWSSWSKNGYAVGVAKSESGDIRGPWTHEKRPFYAQNGGHGMLFEAEQGAWYYALHFPDDKYREAPVFLAVSERGGRLALSEVDSKLGDR